MGACHTGVTVRYGGVHKVDLNMFKSKWSFIIAGAVLLLIGIGLFFATDMVNEAGERNYISIAPTVGCLLFGGLSLLIGLKTEGKVDINIYNKKETRQAIKKRVNTMGIFVKKDIDGKYVPFAIRFYHLKNPSGRLRLCENDNKRYYVKMFDTENRRMVDLTLPDTVYVLPRKYAAIPLTMPHDKEYWKQPAPLWQKLAPGIMVLVIIIEWIFAITTGD